ncbi:MAG: hypothetical protein VYC39_04635 [Myxococcota bacterium]|nr:hypothetical protein [Myxococcota bacterium]
MYKSGASVKNTQPKKTVQNLLDPAEERLLRMKEGQSIEDDLPLQQMGLGHADTMARLREIELEAFMATNRVEELRSEAGVTAEASDGPTKNKIISRLSGGQAESVEEATISAGASSKSDSNKK